MTLEHDRSSNASLNPELELQLDRICNRFEDLLRVGQSPSVEEFLADVPDSARDTLLCELQGLESDYRRRQEQTVAVGDGSPQRIKDFDFLHGPQQPDEIGRLGEYRVLEVLGVGGMGIVFRAEDPQLQRLIALKVMKPEVARSDSAKDRFLREAKATAAIEHDNIVAIYRVGEDRGVPFMAMPLLRGESLQTRLRRVTSLDQREVLRIGREVAAGLSAAHERNLIHRDIKPDNIWLEEQTGRTKILDFGLVRLAAIDGGLTESGMVLGTPRYMAPEQAQGESIDGRCDLFSLGCVLYQLAAGRVPFDGRNATAMLLAVAQANPTPVQSLCPHLHPDLAGLIMRLLSRNRNLRPNSASEVVRAILEIEASLSARPSTQLPAIKSAPPISSPLRKQPRTRDLWAGLGVAIASVLLLAFVGLWATGWIASWEPGPTSNSTAPKGRGDSLPAPARLSDREAAQWALDLGAEIAVSTESQSGIFIKPPGNLPAAEFSLTWIDFSGNRELTNDDLRRLAGLESLTELNLSRTRITDEGLAHLLDLPSLIYLNVVETDITDEGLAGLVELPQLSQLYLSRCRISDAAIPILRKLKLDQLTLDGTQVTFDGIRQLGPDSSISSLNVTHLNLSESELRQLRETLSNCQIETNQGVFGPQTMKN